ncbi:MAG TPA: ion channel [Lysobacter sp.]|nr:ion channel [Lysobacter sp.]
MSTRPSAPIRLLAHARRHPSAVLLAVQLLGVFLYPVMEHTAAGRAAYGAFGMLVLALALWVVNRSPTVNWVAWLLAAPAAVLALVASMTPHPEWLVWAHLLQGLLYLYAAGGLILYMLRDHQVTRDEWFAAGAAFTLLAWAFAFAFSVCQSWYPDSFGDGAPLSWMELLYLSFATLSGVGLSDIAPRIAPARSLVMLEMFAGLMYIAVVVSRLVGLAMVARRSP